MQQEALYATGTTTIRLRIDGRSTKVIKFTVTQYISARWHASRTRVDLVAMPTVVTSVVEWS